MAIKVIAFDVGGVLALVRKNFSSGKSKSRSVHMFVAKKIGVDLDGYFDAIETNWSASIEGRISRKETLKIMAYNLGTTPEKIESAFLDAYDFVFKRNDELYNVAYKLAKNYKIMILSDQWPVSKEGTIKESDEKRFDYSIISCEIGFRKPDVRIYEFALNRAGIAPNEMLFIDNREWNIEEANKMGIKTILFKNNKQCINELCNIGVLK